MFGLEKKQRELFKFDLEKELEGNAQKTQTLIQEMEGVVHNIKSLLRSGTETSDFDQYGILLHGYTALLKVLHRISHKK